VQWAAFLGDCPHEVKPVTAGHRVTLTYLIMHRPAAATSIPSALWMGKSADGGRGAKLSPQRAEDHTSSASGARAATEAGDASLGAGGPPGAEPALASDSASVDSEVVTSALVVAPPRLQPTVNSGNASTEGGCAGARRPAAEGNAGR